MHYWWPGNGAIKTRRQPGGCFNNGADEDVWGIKVHWVSCGSLKQKRKDKVELTKTLLEQATLTRSQHYTVQEADKCVEATECSQTVPSVVLAWLRAVWVIFCWLQGFECSQVACRAVWIFMNVWTFVFFLNPSSSRDRQYVLQMLFVHLGGAGCVDCEPVLIHPAS